MLTLRLYVYTTGDTLTVQVNEDDTVDVLLTHLTSAPSEQVRARVIYNGRALLLRSTFRESGVENNATIHLVAVDMASNNEGDTEIPELAEVYHAGLERHLQSGIERQDIIAMRLKFLAQTGFLSTEQLNILYLNPDLLEPYVGYIPPAIEHVRQFFLRALELDENELPGDVRHLYTPQPRLEPEVFYDAEFVSNQSFSLMMLEGGFSLVVLRQFSDITDLSWLDDDMPFPTIPLRALRCEELYYRNVSPTDTPYSIAATNGLLGPGEPVRPQARRIMSDFGRFMTLIVGILIGLILNILVAPYLSQDSIPGPLRTGMIWGLTGCLILSSFIVMTNAF
ncbi:hypothetical protein GMRT_13076 [Giardia muris]|uniref:Ubiquitin-like domain-containing protein n=1 Tax=Giardia muris TaxID=5742 RepID=A0A4Z1SXC0_GIAMU|nr:hypothetical protein GMRT_13076 [Giardia muris]|eukprot:TNJ30374.1 hypothetical protein GMRT_13076 [Giardia muris]